MLTLTFNSNSYTVDKSKFHSKDDISNYFGIPSSRFYMVQNGRIITEIVNTESMVHVVLRLVGGKGGFGSMLRAIGAQIEKTTNREACRDLSGRRLRDINEEKRLKNWINQQAEREKEAEDRRQKKLERLCQQPRHEFKDEEYDKARSELPDKVEDALEQGLKASCSSGSKRKQTEVKTKKKKAKLWLGSEDELSSEDSEDDNKSSKPDSEDSNQTNDIPEKIEATKQSEENVNEETQEKKPEINEELKNESLVA